MPNRYEYSVVELREGMIGGKMSGDKLEKVLNQHAREGWHLRAITSVDVKGRIELRLERLQLGPKEHLPGPQDPFRRGEERSLEAPMPAGQVDDGDHDRSR